MTRLWLAALFAIGLFVPRVALAAPRVAVTPIPGDKSGDMRDAVTAALDGDDLKVVSLKETRRAVKRVKGGISDLDEKQARKLSRDLEADALLHVTLRKKKRTKLLHFAVYIYGKKTRGFSVQFSNARSKKFRRALHNKILDKIENAPKPEKVASRDSDDDADEDAPKKSKKHKKHKKKHEKKKRTEVADADDADAGDDADDDESADEDDDEDVADADEGGDKKGDKDDDDKERRGDKKVAARDADDGDSDGDGDASVTKRASSGAKGAVRSPNRVAVRVDVGGTASARSLVFTSSPDLIAAKLNPKSFRPGPVPSLRAEGELYPGALLTSGPGAWIGVGFEYDKVLSSKVAQADPMTGDVVSGKVDQIHYTVGGRIRVPFGDQGYVVAGAGYGRRTFKVRGASNRAAIEVPDTDYKYIAPALGFRLPVFGPVAFSVLGEAMLVRDAGQITTATQYGRAKVFGVDVEGGIDVLFMKRFVFRVAGEFTQIGYKFTGGGDKANNLDGDPTTVDIGGAADRTIGGLATLAVLY